MKSLLALLLAYLSIADAFAPRSLAASTKSTTVLHATVAENVQEKDQAVITKKTPIILLAGFLGTGKTTALKHLLENKEGAKIGLVVNDVASVNIDAKLVSSMPESVGENNMIELQNGCACCSLSDELFTSVETLFQPNRSNSGNNKKKREYDAIVVELSGVADPMAIKATWKAAEISDAIPPVIEMAEISKIVTMIDACTFGTDYMTWDDAAQRPGWVSDTTGVIGVDAAGNRKVAELLAEQVEAADLILVNKVDMATPEEVAVASKVARALNTRATLLEVSFGKISPLEMLKLGTSSNTVEDKKKEEKEAAHSHDDHDVACQDATCTDETHSHSHAHDHACQDAQCTDESHSHDAHAHAHDTTTTTAACAEPGCSDTSHSHSHAHESESAQAEACIDPGCSDTSHSHSHSHSHATSTDNLGIVNFVYKAARPFSTPRLMALLNTWPVPVKDVLDLKVLEEAQTEGYDMGNDNEPSSTQEVSPFVGVLRSKGFCWMAPTKWSGANWDAYRHDTAMYWSHAGKHFGLSSNGKWWGSIQVYEGWEAYMKKMFKNNMEEYERIMREDFVSKEFGDRRQEIVFIGVKLDQKAITKALDDCLLTDAEMVTYRQNLKNHQDTVLGDQRGKSLFSMDGDVEHTEA